MVCSCRDMFSDGTLTTEDDQGELSFHNATQSWADARAACRGQATHLAALESLNELLSIRAQLTNMTVGFFT